MGNIQMENLRITTQYIQDQVLSENNVSLAVLRLDLVDPVISGNKLFKLQPYLQDALLVYNRIITFGGPYSNHLAATAAACNRNNVRSVGIIRGERSSTLSATLLYCESQEMILKFIPREEYKKKTGILFANKLREEFGEHILIPEGGYGIKGVNGASKIAEFYGSGYSHICCPVGTATTLAGLIKGSDNNISFIGFSAIKALGDFDERMSLLLPGRHLKNYVLNNTYHFGGFAKRTPELIDFMNRFFQQHSVPSDFVYTAKMFFGILELVKSHYFKSGSKILCIHTGGLQGNLSLPPGTLCF